MSVLLVDFESDEASSIAALLDEAGLPASTSPKGSMRSASDSAGFDAIVISSHAHADRAIAQCVDLRRAGYHGAIVVVGDTGKADQGISLLERGADDFLARPLREQELVARLKAVLRRATRPARLTYGPLVVDPSERTAHLRGRPLRLTTREYGLLALLVEANGRMISRPEMLERVWHRSTDATSNLIEAHMSRLRDKLDADASLIETVRREGYRMRRL